MSRTALEGYRSRDVSPNRGRAVEDFVAVGDNSMTQAEFRKACNVDPASQVKLNKIAFMRYQHPDLQQISTLLKGPSSY